MLKDLFLSCLADCDIKEDAEFDWIDQRLRLISQKEEALKVKEKSKTTFKDSNAMSKMMASMIAEKLAQVEAKEI